MHLYNAKQPLLQHLHDGMPPAECQTLPEIWQKIERRQRSLLYLALLCNIPRINVLHGVTSVTEGVRKCLFIVDRMNGLGHDGVITLTNEDIFCFLAQREL